MLVTLHELYAYKNMIYNLVRKDLRTRYKGSFLGFFWTFLNPLLQLIVYGLLFSIVMRINMDQYYLYLFIGLIPWVFCSTSTIEASKCIMTNHDLIKKIYFPRAVLPIALVTSGFMNMIFSMVVVLLSLLVMGRGLSVYVVLLPLVMLIEYLFLLTVALFVSSITVYLRDLEHILNIIVMGWFYFTPVVYPMSYVPEKYLKFFIFNPMYPIIDAYQKILYWKEMPNMVNLGCLTIGVVILLVCGFYTFQKLQKGFAEEL